MNVTIGEAREERRKVVDRMLVIEADLAESKRAWMVQAGGMAPRQRAVLEAELAALRLQRSRLNNTVKDQDRAILAAERAARENGMLAITLALLEERGMKGVIDEARARFSAYSASLEDAPT